MLPKESRENIPIKPSSIFVTAFTSFMANISRYANIFICKRAEAMRNYAFFAGQQRMYRKQR